MYTYLRAVGVKNLDPEGEELLDIANVPVNQLRNLYSKLTIVIKDSYLTFDVCFQMADYYNQFATFNGTIQQWLDSVSNTNLIVSNTLPGTEYRYVTCQDIQYKGFSLKPGDVTISDGDQARLTPHNANDIRVVRTDRDDFDHDPLVERCLWTINGHLVRAVKGTNCLYLVNAGKHYRLNDNIHVTCLNFNTVSKLNTYTIEDKDIRYIDNNTFGHLHYKAPIDVSGKTVLMSIGGRLYFPDIIKPVGGGGFSIRTSKVDWASRMFESKDLIDIGHILDKERQVVDGRFFNNEAFFRALLTDKSSFLIVLDNPNLYFNTKPLIRHNFPFNYETEQTLNLPLMTGSGLLPKYYTRKIINRRILSIDAGIKRRLINQTTGVNNGGNLFHNYKSLYNPSDYHEGFHLIIRGIGRKD